MTERFFMPKTERDIMIEIKNMGNKVFRLAYANVIVRKLWIKGLISEEERDKLMEKNKSC